MREFIKNQKKHAGFTLIEVLLAIFLVGVIMVIGQQIIQNLNQVQVRLAKNQADLTELQRVFQRFQQDFTYIQSRSVRDTTGQQISPAFQLIDEGQGQILRFTRTAKIGVDIQVLRIEYFIENRNLVRTQSNILDAYYNNVNVNKKVILKNIEKIEFGLYMKGQNQKIPLYPLPTNANNPNEINNSLPDATQINIQYKPSDDLSNSQATLENIEWWFLLKR